MDPLGSKDSLPESLRAADWSSDVSETGLTACWVPGLDVAVARSLRYFRAVDVSSLVCETERDRGSGNGTFDSFETGLLLERWDGKLMRRITYSDIRACCLLPMQCLTLSVAFHQSQVSYQAFPVSLAVSTLNSRASSPPVAPVVSNRDCPPWGIPTRQRQPATPARFIPSTKVGIPFARIGCILDSIGWPIRIHD
jgi:hypothetical protein